MPRTGHIALAGAPNVGKSSLLNALVGEHLAIVSPKAQATREPVVGLRTEAEVQYIFHDLPGLLDPSYLLQTRMRQAALDRLSRAHVILHLHPATAHPAEEFGVLAGLKKPLEVPVLVTYTKADLLSQEARSRLGENQLLVSSKTGEGLERLLKVVADLLPEAPFQFDPEDLGTQPMRFFAAEFLREAAFEALSDEVPYAVAVEIEEFREDRRPLYIRAHLYVERDSQKAILIGKNGSVLKAIGMAARSRLEGLLGQPVYLDTWVKVMPHWPRDGTLLTRLGLPDPTS